MLMKNPSSVGSESAPYFNDVPVVLGSSSHGGERKRPGTGHNSTCEWSSHQRGGTYLNRGGALTIKGAFYCESPTSVQVGPTPLVRAPLTSTVMACPWPFSFASVRARTQDHSDIIEMGSTLTTN